MNNREATQPPFIAQFASGKPQKKYLIFYIQTKILIPQGIIEKG